MKQLDFSHWWGPCGNKSHCADLLSGAFSVVGQVGLELGEDTESLSAKVPSVLLACPRWMSHAHPSTVHHMALLLKGPEF